MAFDILMPLPMAPAILAALESKFRVVKLWQEPSEDTALDRVADSIRGIAAAGHRPIDGSFMRRFKHLEIVANFGVGYDHVDAAWAGQHGIIVTNTPDVLSDEVADTTLALILATVRQLPAAERYLRAGSWLKAPFPLSQSLRGRTVGILGLGRIGKAVAKRAEAFGLSVVYHGRHPQPDVPYRYCETIIALAQAADILVVLTPGGRDTVRLIDAAVLEALGPDGILINVARGSVVDEAALVDALRAGTIRSAGLDVFEREPNVPQALIDMDHVVLLPHVGSGSSEARNAMGRLLVDNLVSWAAGTGPLTPVAETPWRPEAT